MEKVHNTQSRPQRITLLDTSSRLDNRSCGKEKFGRRAIQLPHERVKLGKFFPHNTEKVITPNRVKAFL